MPADGFAKAALALRFQHSDLPASSGTGNNHTRTWLLDIIFINNLRVETVIGIYDWERKIRQLVVIDLELGADCAAAAKTDSVEDTLDYKAISGRVVEFVAASEFGLVETLADRTALLIMEEFGVPWVRLRLNKLGALSGASDVGVIVERGRRD